MKKNVRNALAISGLALAMGASAFTLEASANNGSGARIQRSHQERIVRTKKIKTEKVASAHRFVSGTVSAVGENSITLTRGTKTYTVNIASDTRLLNRKWQTITLADIKVDNKLKVSGEVVDTVVTAKTVRDISLF
jgi:hypothetical protein